MKVRSCTHVLSRAANSVTLAIRTRPRLMIVVAVALEQLSGVGADLFLANAHPIS